MKDSKDVTCPKCNHVFDLSSALKGSIESDLREKLREDFEQKEKLLKDSLSSKDEQITSLRESSARESQELREKLRLELSQEYQSLFAIEKADLQKQILQQKSQAANALRLEIELTNTKLALQEMQDKNDQKLELEVSKRLLTQEQDHALKVKQLHEANQANFLAFENEKAILKTNLEKDLTESIREKFIVDQKHLEERLAAEKLKSQEAQKNELEFRRLKVSLEEQKQTQELEFQRKLDEERDRIAEEVRQRTQTESAKIIDEQNLKMATLQRALDDARLKATQGSQQTQGEALELRLEEELARMFPNDEFEPVGKGVRGADLIHRVKSHSGKHAGTIVWEFKQTKNWSDDWVVKLKEDQRELSAELAAIVSSVIPKNHGQLGTTDGVWIAQPALAKALAQMLREQILHVFQARITNQIPADQKENVFKYLTGTKFKQSLEAEISTVSNLILDLQKEKRAFSRMWASREQQLNQLLALKGSLYGDLQGILGKSLPSIATLELEEPNPEEPGE
ncbi:MAG: DUF2130 domain-containing protein [Bdellovibrionaceae bacterium]|nr:DUF2130 domain-containing protein [Pseudobdellovibrionaceae bacterium]